MKWNPIESAPRDGKPILGFAFELEDEYYSNKGICETRYSQGSWWAGHYPFLPTHWVPLPNPPCTESQNVYNSETPSTGETHEEKSPHEKRNA